MISRRFGAAVLILGSGSFAGCILVGTGGSGTGGAGGQSTTSAVTSTVTSSGNTGVTSTTGNTGPGATTGNTGATTSSTTSTSSGGTCMAPAGDTAVDCASACGTAYDCGVLSCGGTGQQCPGFKSPLTRTAFIGSSTSNGCLENCMISPTFVNLVDPTDCVATVQNLKANSGSYALACQSGG